MHGGAEGSGAPKGNQNALKHGRYTKVAIEERRAQKKFMREADKFLAELDS
jgi:glucans biosynthesis protein